MSSNTEISERLALYLLEAIINEEINKVKQLLKHKASPNVIPRDKGYAAIHYCAGMENTQFSETAMDVLLEANGDPNVQTVLERLTPLHIACMGGHYDIVLKLMKHGGNINIVDEDGVTPIQYAIDESHYDIVLLIKKFLFEQKIEKIKSKLLQVPKSNTNGLLQNLEESQYTPNHRNYNYNATSPYYLHITQRQGTKCNKPILQVTEGESAITPNNTKALMETSTISMSATNLFDLTENNLMEFTRIHNPNRTRDSLINIWRHKLKHPSHTSIRQIHNDLDELLTEFEVENDPQSKDTSETGSTVIIMHNQVASYDTHNETVNGSFHTANDNFIKSPSKDVIIQVAESYIHTDNEIGMVFYEKKLLPSDVSQPNVDPNDSCSSLSASFTVPSDYGTDQLRNELETFGQIAGPITKSTKRLYLKRLIKFKRSKDKMLTMNAVPANDITLNFSVELRKTLNNESWFDTIDKHLEFEKEMVESIQKLPKHALREGHLKTSFVYLLIDPRISDNLPGQYKFLTKSQTWEKFLASIFYVGKGKSSRPYSHLYDAIQFYNGLLDAEVKKNCVIKSFRNLKLSDGDENILFVDRNAPPYDRSMQIPQQNYSPTMNGGNRKQTELTIKLDRIVNIWQSSNGVVCLHLFHNILPTEAYTREASIIECLTLNHLTNKKGGDYYGICKTWTMRKKKNLGVGLLYRAMQTYLAQGESQLMPRDLL